MIDFSPQHTGLDIDPGYVIYCAFECAGHTAADYELVTELETQSVTTTIETTAVVLHIKLKCKKHPSNPVGLDHGH